MTKYTLYLITYDRGRYPITNEIKPYHWLFFIQTSSSGSQTLGIAHHLRGMPGAFHYSGPETLDLDQSSTSLAEAADLVRCVPPKEKLEIGEVEEEKMDRVREVFEEVGIVRTEYRGWNCQNWGMEALERLRGEACVYEWITGEGVRRWLKEG
ncbi:hypothetical protein B0J11DRAFT_575136 [Dendryphion nanum]|uniref:Uncharacterized protein n=1 Tax=Dendryphion nanum TaxID=256645 RepID=A0A9P9IXE0_9PLEO|nr:hypothetical protein B0J11DRAFT_575136 [Dendryphion nanum]